MKKTVLHAALFSISLPMSLYALGLGEMKVESYLDQPFVAEIDLVDVGSTSIGAIRVGLADPENFERIGLERIAVLSLLDFKVEKNAQGRLVIKVRSKERITEPYMDVIVDLAWPSGQLFKAYTVLLDPPGYQLLTSRQKTYSTYSNKSSSSRDEAGVVDKTIISSVSHETGGAQDARNQTTYGPTITNENVWQIAQRYKTSEVMLPQVVLAIVGANPDAFTDGNLNGLKVGIRLVIPATRDIQQVPSDLATQEVMAHDAAWNDKKSINHVISPPYMGYQARNMNEPDLESVLPTVPKFTQTVAPSLSSLNKLISVNSFMQVAKKEQPQPAKMQQTELRESTTKAEIAITTAAVETVRESNAVLMAQLRLLQDQNKKLQQQLDNRDKDIQSIRTQLGALTKDRQAVASEASTATKESESSNMWPIFLLLLGICGGGGTAFWYLRRRDQESEDAPFPTTKLIEPKPFIPEVPVVNTQTVDTSKPVVIADQTHEEAHETKEQPELDSNPVAEPVKIKHSKKKKTRSVKPEDVTLLSAQPQGPEEHTATPPSDKIIEVQATPADFHSGSIENESADSIKVTAINTLKDTNDAQEPKEDLADLEFESAMESKPIESSASQDPTPLAPLSPLENELLNSLKPGKGLTEQSDEANQDGEELPDLEFEPYVESETEPSVEAPKEVKLPQEAVAKESEEKIEELPDLEFVSSIESESHDKGDDQATLASKNDALDSVTENSEGGKEDEPGDMLEFESGLHQLFPEEPVEKGESVQETSQENTDDILDDLVFESIDSEDNQEPEIEINMDFLNDTAEQNEHEDNSPIELKSDSEEFKNIISSSTQSNPLKSTKALDTLISLAKTYIGMDDLESARHSLDEVIEHGNEAQKEEAGRLLDELNNKQ